MAIHTFTGNPLAETTLEFTSWTAGSTQRAKVSSFQMGGKGINVAKMLRRLGRPIHALTFLGGTKGERCRAWLQERGYSFTAFETKGETREGFVVRAPGQAETTFLGPDSAPDSDAWLAAAEYLSTMDWRQPGTGTACPFAFCGSCPGFMDTAAAPFRERLAVLIRAGLPVSVDTYGPALEWCVGKPVDLVKINAEEFRSLLGENGGADTRENLQQALTRWPVRAWVISDGARPVWYAEAGGVPRRIEPPMIEEISATGSGDVLMACLLHARHGLGYDLEQALSFGLPQAAANAAHPGIAEF